MYRAGIVTLSDKGAAGEREDVSGAVIREILEEAGYEVVSYRLLADEGEDLKEELMRLSDEVECDLVLTTGGTGFSPRDVTPEATLTVADRNAPGIAEAIRAYSMTVTKRAMLSRGASVIRGSTLIINLPGSPKAVRESLEYILDTLSHGLEILQAEVENVPEHQIPCRNKTEDQETIMKVLIKGAGDLATGIGCRLHRCGFELVMTDIAVPTTVRRTVAFSRAVYEEEVKVEDITGVLCHSLEEIHEAIARDQVAVVVDEECKIRETWKPDVVVDAIIAKKRTWEPG